MIVKIDGNFNPDGTTGVAASIEFKDNLEGPVDSVDPASNTIIVLGQTVNLNSTTYFDDFTNISGDSLIDVYDITAGNVVEVSGLVDADGIIHASYISLKSETFESDGDEIELKGTITYDQITGTFAIGSLAIDFSSAGLEAIALNAANNGLYVEVKSTSAPNDNNVLIASSIEIEDEGHEADEGDRIEIEGFVTTGLDNDNLFELEGHIVQINDYTKFEDGGGRVDIIPNARVEVKGTVDAYGVLVADEIEVESDDDASGEAAESNDSGTDDSGTDNSGTDDSNDNSDVDSGDDSSDTDGEDAAE
jgi:hypothetical protein